MASRLKSLSRLRNRSKRLCEFSRSKSPFTSFSKESFGERGVVSIDRDSSGYLLSQSNQAINHSLYRDILLSLLALPCVSEQIEGDLLEKLQRIAIYSDKLSQLINSLKYGLKREYQDELVQSLSAENQKLRYRVQQLTKSLQQSQNNQSVLSLELKNSSKTSKLSVIFKQKELNNSIESLLKSRQQSQIFKSKEKIVRQKSSYRGLQLTDMLKIVMDESDLKKGITSLCTASKFILEAKHVFYFYLNPQKTYFITPTSDQYMIPANSSILSIVLLEKKVVQQKEKTSLFDQKLRYYINSVFKSYTVAPISFSNDQVSGLLLATSSTEVSPNIPEEIISIFSIAIQKWKYCKNEHKIKRSLKALLQSQYQLLEQSSIHDFSTMLSQHIPSYINCQRCLILILDHNDNKLVNKHIIPPRIFSLTRGIAGSCATTKRPIIANNVNNDKRFQREVDDPFCLSTQNLLAVPLIQLQPAQVRAVILCMDKLDEEVFDEYDIKLLQDYSLIIIKILDAVRTQENFHSMSHLLQRMQGNMLSLFKNIDSNDSGYQDILNNIRTMMNN